MYQLLVGIILNWNTY